MATSEQMIRCPQSWGVPDTATSQDVMGKVLELEKSIADNLEYQRQQMVEFRQEIAAIKKVEVKTNKVNDVHLVDTPSKKRKLAEAQVSEIAEKSYASTTIHGVQPLGGHPQPGFLGVQQHPCSPRVQQQPSVYLVLKQTPLGLSFS